MNFRAQPASHKAQVQAERARQQAASGRRAKKRAAALAAHACATDENMRADTDAESAVCVNAVGRRSAWAGLTLVLVALIWGSGFVATEYVLKAGWNTAQIMAARFSLAALILFVVLGRKLRRCGRGEIKTGVVAGFFLFVSFYLQTWGQAFTTVSNAAFFTATNVVMVPFISWVINRDRPRLPTVLLSLLALAGMAVLSYSEGSFSLNTGDLLILGCAFFFALHITWLEKATREGGAALINFWQILTAALISLLFWAFGPGARADFSLSGGLLPLLYLGAFSTCLCYFMQTRAQQFCKASTVGVILSLEGFFGSLFSVLLGLEAFSLRLALGGALIISASLLINFVSPKSE